MNDIARIPLTNSDQLCLISSHHYDKVITKTWHRHILSGAIHCNNHPQKSLAEFITGEKNMDHANRLKWDNRDCNLRKANSSQNNRNVPAKSNNTSGAKGVFILKQHGLKKKYWAYIVVKGKRTGLGTFLTLKEASDARDEAAKQLHGEFACLNGL